MRALLIVISLVTLGAGAFTLTLKRGAIAAPTDTASESEHAVDAPANAAPAPAEAREIAAAASDAPAIAAASPQPEPAPEARAPLGPAPAAPGPRPTHVEVRNLVDDALVARFRWSFTAGAQTVRDEGLFGVADLPLPIGVPGVLLVEADGMEPLRQEAVTATAAPQPALQLRLYLRPTRPAAGITMLVRDNVGQPVDHLRVDAFSLGESARSEQWQLGRPLWSRRASAADGRYQLPPLPAGDYGVQLRATDADGVLRPLQSWTRPFTLTGDNGFVEDVTLQPGCALRLELVDASGAPLDPAARGS
ncbi:MAG: hypothetical protein VYA51_12460, partial [Planctomycetota bacterium]|nr:hypothetical protein [Planctomycetota bacterium]